MDFAPSRALKESSKTSPVNLRFFLVLSFGLNLALAAALFVRWRNPGGPVAEPSISVAAPGLPMRAAGADPTPATASAVPKFSFHWSALESDDYRQYVSNLVAVGCPERTIRDIIVADIDELYSTRIESLPAPDPEPWMNADGRRARERSRAAKAAALKAEKRALVKELIGYEWDNRANEIWHEDFMATLALGFLPDDKPPQLLAILKKYRELAEDVKSAANGILIEEDRAQLRKLHDALMAEATQLLSPADWEEVRLRGQAEFFLAAHNIGWNGFAISGPELREYARLSRAFQDPLEEEFLGRPEPSEAEQAVRQTAFEKEVARLFGLARFAEYQRAQDPGFREGWEFTQERKLPAAAAIRIHGARRTAEEQAGEINRDPALSNEQKAGALAKLKTTTAAAISSALGDAYRDYLDGPGQWLEGLAATESPAHGGDQ
jgi:hypothetical protein